MAAGGNINLAIGPDDHTHGEFETVGKGGRAVVFAVVVKIFEDQKPVGIMALVVFRPEVCIGFQGPDTALIVDIKSCRSNDLRLFGEK